ncbi:predicted protein [Naegleria gruberi]|uniref:Predicted protein n=1 Tax=Naegleria gruberi TaxID=5762 RepID=D2VD89_NAEGR|nr:uncharacterized protein NAEGRDRAFT_48552 [Naegleria gruberi]EFC45190.1 predicted protein [Naegleria gruberi]|eukprot:XP_002677934.1 predicted protein [Naegleria gruberi strain NEG-M]
MVDSIRKKYTLYTKHVYLLLVLLVIVGCCLVDASEKYRISTVYTSSLYPISSLAFESKNKTSYFLQNGYEFKGLQAVDHTTDNAYSLDIYQPMIHNITSGSRTNYANDNMLRDFRINFIYCKSTLFLNINKISIGSDNQIITILGNGTQGETPDGIISENSLIGATSLAIDQSNGDIYFIENQFNIRKLSQLTCEDGICDKDPEGGNASSLISCFGIQSSEPLVCSGNGYCAKPNECSCKAGFIGEQCQSGPVYLSSEIDCTDSINFFICGFPICFGIQSSDPFVCSGNGYCAKPNVCTCKAGFIGAQCQSVFLNATIVVYESPLLICFGIQSSDPLVCSGNGNCTLPNKCACKPGFLGSACQEVDISLTNSLINTTSNSTTSSITVIGSTITKRASDDVIGVYLFQTTNTQFCNEASLEAQQDADNDFKLFFFHSPSDIYDMFLASFDLNSIVSGESPFNDELTVLDCSVPSNTSILNSTQFNSTFRINSTTNSTFGNSTNVSSINNTLNSTQSMNHSTIFNTTSLTSNSTQHFTNASYSNLTQSNTSITVNSTNFENTISNQTNTNISLLNGTLGVSNTNTSLNSTFNNSSLNTNSSSTHEEPGNFTVFSNTTSTSDNSSQSTNSTFNSTTVSDSNSIVSSNTSSNVTTIDGFNSTQPTSLNTNSTNVTNTSVSNTTVVMNTSNFENTSFSNSSIENSNTTSIENNINTLNGTDRTNLTLENSNATTLNSTLYTSSSVGNITESNNTIFANTSIENSNTSSIDLNTTLNGTTSDRTNSTVEHSNATTINNTLNSTLDNSSVGNITENSNTSSIENKLNSTLNTTTNDTKAISNETVDNSTESNSTETLNSTIFHSNNLTIENANVTGNNLSNINSSLINNITTDNTNDTLSTNQTISFNNTSGIGCREGYYGANCSLPICFGILSEDPNVCNGTGNCTKPNYCENKTSHEIPLTVPNANYTLVDSVYAEITPSFDGVTFKLFAPATYTSNSISCSNLIHSDDVSIFGTEPKCFWTNKTNSNFKIQFDYDFKLDANLSFRLNTNVFLKKTKKRALNDYTRMYIIIPNTLQSPVAKIKSTKKVYFVNEDIYISGANSYSGDKKELEYYWNIEGNSIPISVFSAISSSKGSSIKVERGILRQGVYNVSLIVKSKATSQVSSVEYLSFEIQEVELPAVSIIGEKEVSYKSISKLVTIKKTAFVPSYLIGQQVNIDWEQVSGPSLKFRKDSKNNLIIDKFPSGQWKFIFKVSIVAANNQANSDSIIVNTIQPDLLLSLSLKESSSLSNSIQVNYVDPESNLDEKEVWQWNCVNSESNGYCGSSASGKLTQYSLDQSTLIIMKKEDFVSLEKPKFTLTITKGERQVSASITLNIVHSPPIVKVINVSPASKSIVKGNDKISIEVIHSERDVSDSSMLLKTQWKIDGFILYESVSSASDAISTAAASPFSSYAKIVNNKEQSGIIIDVSGLEEGIDHSVQFLVSFVKQQSGSNELIEISLSESTFSYFKASKPKKCPCSVIPSAGFSMTTDFTLTCQNCQNEANTIQIKQGYIDAESGIKVGITLTPEGTFKLPAMNHEIVNLYIELIDSATGESRIMYSNVTVTSIIVSSISEIFKQVTNQTNIIKTSFIQDGDASQSISQTINTIVSATQMLKTLPQDQQDSTIVSQIQTQLLDTLTSAIETISEETISESTSSIIVYALHSMVNKEEKLGQNIIDKSFTILDNVVNQAIKSEIEISTQRVLGLGLGMAKTHYHFINGQYLKLGSYIC